MKTKLPAYMVPTHFVVLKEFPLTPNGKIDLRRLPVPETSSETAPNYVAPRTEEEQCLAEMFQEVLMLKQVGATNNFFDLGCDSLSATRAFARINKVFGVQITLRDVFEHRTISSLADVVSKSRGASAPRRQVIPRRPRVAQLS